MYPPYTYITYFVFETVNSDEGDFISTYQQYVVYHNIE